MFAWGNDLAATAKSGIMPKWEREGFESATLGLWSKNSTNWATDDPATPWMDIHLGALFPDTDTRQLCVCISVGYLKIWCLFFQNVYICCNSNKWYVEREQSHVNQEYMSYIYSYVRHHTRLISRHFHSQNSFWSSLNFINSSTLGASYSSSTWITVCAQELLEIHVAVQEHLKLCSW